MALTRSSNSVLAAFPLAHLDPDGGLDDLEPLRDVIGSARVVGIGETAHFVREFQQMRHRLVRFLVERMGFGVVAFESGFSEGLALDRWVRGGAGDFPAGGLTYRFGRSSHVRRFFTWMRDTGTATYTGLDLPGTLASMLPALDNLDRYVTRADPAAVDTLAAIRRHASAYAGEHTMPAFAAYRAMPAADRDALTVLLAELAVRFDTLRPFLVRRSDADSYDTVRHELRLAGLLDQALRMQAAAAGGSMAHAAVNVRDAAMAGSVLRQVARSDARIALVVANSHLQRLPVLLGGRVEVPVLGGYLADDLGDDYVAMAMTCAGGRVPARRPAPSNPRGMELVDVDLAEPVAGSVEALMPFASHGAHVADLRPLRSTVDAPVRLRTLESYIDVPVADAFDLVAGVPTISPLPPDER